MLQTKHKFLALVHLGFTFIYVLRMNLSVAVVSMKEFEWTEAQQGVLLSTFFYGYVISQIPGGVIVGKYGGKSVAGIVILTSSVLTLLTPIAADVSFYLISVVRVCSGLAQGMVYPALLVLLRNWSTVGDRNQMVSIATTGTETGAVLAFSLGGVLCDSYFLGTHFVFTTMTILDLLLSLIDCEFYT